MIRIVVDTNVLISGLLKPSGNEALILLAIHQGIVKLALSAEILGEYSSVLLRPKFGFPQDQIEAVMAMVRKSGDVVVPNDVSAVSPDPNDSKFLHCAIAAQADYLVTGNRRDFPASSYGRTQVVNAAELLDRITLEIRGLDERT